jgi:hypothetical protein
VGISLVQSCIISITGGGGSGASASPVISNGAILSISNFNAGSGFTLLPNVSISVGYNANYSVDSPITGLPGQEIGGD